MKKATLLTLPFLLATLLTPAFSSGGDFLLYTPKPAEKEQAPASPDQGVLVRSVTIKNGDTLADLSRKYIGKSGWFPQVLVFNNIKNPDLIITGDKLLIPVPAGQKGASEQKAAPERKHAKGKKRHHAGRRATHSGAARAEAARLKKSQPRDVASDEQERYLQAKLVYLSGDYQKSLALFTEFLHKFPHSDTSADAALYRADSLLHLSGQ